MAGAAAARVRLLIWPAIARAALLSQLSVGRTNVLGRLDEIEAALLVANSSAASALLLTLDDATAPGSMDDATLLTTLGDDDRRALLRRESAARLALREAPVPVIAVADGGLTGASAALFLAASHRVCTQRTSFALNECRSGLCPGFGLLSALGAVPQPHVSMAAALGCLELSAHDCIELGLATHYARSDELGPLFQELRASPPAYYDVPLARRTATAAPLYLVPLYASERGAPLNKAIAHVFGAKSDELPLRLLLERLRTSQQAAAQHAAALAIEPCGIHIRTRERVEATRDALAAACASPPTSICMHTFVHACICLHAYMRACMHVRMPACMCACPHACAHARMHVRMPACVQHMHACRCAALNESIRGCPTALDETRAAPRRARALLHACMDAHIHACMHGRAHACMHTGAALRRARALRVSDDDTRRQYADALTLDLELDERMRGCDSATV